jgi:prepilin-type N-terminal cleavage/methylation domain-containing protein
LDCEFWRFLEQHILKTDGKNEMLNRSRSNSRRKRQRGFTFIELAIAVVILLFGIVAVVQLVPAALTSNNANRQDTMSTVIGQRLLEQMMLQQLSSTSFTNSDGTTINLGSVTSGGTLVGSPLISGTSNINFGASQVTGYNLSYTDPNDSQSATYDVRWAVITSVVSGSTPTAKRFIVGVWKKNQGVFNQPVYLDTTVQK